MKVKNSTDADKKELDGLIAKEFPANTEEIKLLTNKFIKKYNAKPHFIRGCICSFIFDLAHDELRGRFKNTREDCSYLRKVERKLKILSDRYYETLPCTFEKWFKTVLYKAESDIFVAKKLMGTDKPQKGARKRRRRDTAIKELIHHLDAKNITEMINDVAKFAELAGVLKSSDKGTAEETVRKIYYKKPPRPSRENKPQVSD